MSTETSLSKKIGGKDLVNVGIYTAMYFVITMACGFLGFIPVFIPLLAVICPILGGIPFMLFLTKTKKFGMITISGLLIGILMCLFGMGYLVIFVALIAGLVADFIAKSGNYESKKKSILTNAVFSLWVMGNLLPFYVQRESYMAGLVEGGYGADYTAALEKLLPVWGWPIMTIVCFVSGIIGGLLGYRLCKKHFTRAGIV